MKTKRIVVSQNRNLTWADWLFQWLIEATRSLTILKAQPMEPSHMIAIYKDQEYPVLKFNQKLFKNWISIMTYKAL